MTALPGRGQLTEPPNLIRTDLAGGNVVGSRKTQSKPARAQSKLNELTYIKNKNCFSAAYKIV